MGGFFSVRLAPGVRISASSRGLRAHVGPRGARLHVGGGGTGVSTGTGPFTYYQSVSGRRPRGGNYYAGPTRQQIASAEKQRQAQLVDQALQRIGSIHRQTFGAPVKPTAPFPTLPPYQQLIEAYERQELKNVKWTDRAARKAAKARAREYADAYAMELQRKARDEQTAAATAIDEHWQKLHDNDPDVVIETLAAAFADNEAPVAPAGVHGDEVLLVVLVPDESQVPDREPGITAAGNLSLARMTRGRTAWWYRELVAGHVVVSVREAFAVAPGAASASVVAVRDGGRGLVGRRRCEPLMAVTLTREQLRRTPWEAVSAWQVVSGGSNLIVNPAPKTEGLRPLDLGDQPEIAELVAAVDFHSE